MARATDELQEVMQPITSLINKSEKAQQRLAPGMWQHTMLGEHLRALRLALSLMSSGPHGADELNPEHFRAALRAFADLKKRSKKAQAKFAPDTSHHTLQRNRLRAFRAAESLICARLK